VEVIPAIDLRGGRCVRLVQGDYDRELFFSDDPVAMARHWFEGGATRLHVVDLDGAREGRPVNASVAAAIITAVDIPVQVAGGIRDEAAIDRWIEAGAARVVLGTAAIREPAFAARAAERHGDKIVVSVDGRDGLFAGEGWLEQTELRVDSLMRELSALGVTRFVYTDIAVDGTLAGPNYRAIEALVRAIDRPIISAGGVGSMEHLARLAQTGVEAAIVGRALYDGGLDLRDALEAVH
jgi:phosphoribosylformimino-5-aminoimidazole carboxamide ribotide isomerase